MLFAFPERHGKGKFDCDTLIVIYQKSQGQWVWLYLADDDYHLQPKIRVMLNLAARPDQG